MRKPRELGWEPPLVELSEPLVRYLVQVIDGDMESWTGKQRNRLSKEEALAFVHFLHDSLPKDALR